jgi:hypothetical protein
VPKKPFVQPVGCITDPWLRGNSSLLCIDTNSRNETNPTYISYAISHCDALQPFRYLFSSLFLSLIPFPQPFFWFLSPTQSHSSGYKGSCYFKRSILYWIGKTGGGKLWRHIYSWSTDISPHPVALQFFYASSVPLLHSSHFRSSLSALLFYPFPRIIPNTRRSPKNCRLFPYNICHYIKCSGIAMK